MYGVRDWKCDYELSLVHPIYLVKVITDPINLVDRIELVNH